MHPCVFACMHCLQDGQLETFMQVARRQIKYLEDEVKRLQALG